MMEVSAENLRLLDKRYRTTASIYFALLFSTAIFICLGFVYADSKNAVDSSVLMPLWVAIVFIAVATFALRRRLSRWERFVNAELLKGFSGVLETLQTNSLILGALAETIAVIGFAVAVLGGNGFDAVRAGVVAFIVFFVNLPRKSVWLKIAVNLEKV